MDLLEAPDYAPFQLLTLTRVRDLHREITDRVDIEGLREGGVREVRRVPVSLNLACRDVRFYYPRNTYHYI